MLSQWRVVLTNTGQRVAHGASDGASRTLRHGTGASVAPAEAHGTSKLADQTFPFGIRLRRPQRVPCCPRLGDIFVNLREPPAVRLFRASIE
jgi:hypothetical protein